MNNEQMDALFRKVFGELENGDEQVLGSLSGDAVNREETILTNLKMELKNLGEVPECQISSDRLRDAILSKGTMSAPISPFANWWKFAVPVAACAAVAVFAMQMPKGDLNSSAVPSGTVATSVKMPAQTLNPKIDPHDVVAPVVEETNEPDGADVGVAAEPEKKVVTSPPTKSSRRSSTKPRAQYASRTDVGTQPSLDGAHLSDIHNEALTSVAKPKASSVVSGLAAGALEGFASRNAPSAARGGAAPITDDPSSKVVIVTAGTDPNTRASNATEVDKKNVVFGG
ncbi:MAG: hypothetical protein ACKVQS_08745 [Fimbriimonadaceae bacterium]